jgi:hypothetical protein
VVLRLHETNLVRVRPNGDVLLNTGGWATHKTLRSMNDALQVFGMVVESETFNVPAGRWRVRDADGNTTLYYNSKNSPAITIPARGSSAHTRAGQLAHHFGIWHVPRHSNGATDSNQALPQRIRQQTGAAGGAQQQPSAGPAWRATLPQVAQVTRQGKRLSGWLAP